MKLFYLRPNGHGPTSYFVLASNAEEAAQAINRERARFAVDSCGGAHQDGWGGNGAITPEMLSVAEVGQVLTNDND